MTDKSKTCEDAWWEDRSIPQKVLIVIGFIILGIGLLALLGLVTMALWNWLMPEIFGLKTIDYWQTIGLLILSCILIKGFGGSGSKRSDRKRRQHLRRYMKEEEGLEEPPA